MLEMMNRTPWSAAIYPGWNRERAYQDTLVVKAGYRFDLDGRLELLAAPPPIIPADVHHGDPLASSLRQADEAVPFKAGSEVLLSGTAHPPPPGGVVMETELGLEFTDGTAWRKVLRIIGSRAWKRGVLGLLPGDPEPLEPLALRYEYAYGGKDLKRRALDRRNPVGLGFARRGRVRAGQPLPRIEQGPPFITRAGQQPPPAGYGPIPPAWEPRRAASRGLDTEAAQAGTRCPYGPEIPATLFNCAPADQRFPEPFTGGEAVLLRGFFQGRRAADPVRFRLPVEQPRAGLVVNGEGRWVRLSCDTLAIDTDAREIHLVWRGAVPTGETGEGWVLLGAGSAGQDEEPTT